MPDFNIGVFVIVVLLVIAILVIITNIKIVPQAYAYVIERFGAYKCTWGTGLHFKVPFIDKISKKVSLKERIPLAAGQLATNAQEPSEGPLELLVDGNPDTFFQSFWDE